MKTISRLLGMVVAFLLTLGSFSAHAATQDITIVGGGAGGLWAVMAEGLGEVIRRSKPDWRVTVEPGKDGPNQVMVSRNQVPLGLGYESVTSRAYKGLSPYKSKLENLRAVAVLSTVSCMQFIIDAKAGITSIEQIKERKYPLRIAVNRAGSVMDVAGEAVFKAYGFSYDDIAAWGGKVLKIPGPEAMSLWDAGQVDAIIEISQYPTSRFVELNQKHDLNLLSVAPDKLDALNKDLGTSTLSIEAGAYPFVKEPSLTLNTKVVVLTSAEQPDALIGEVAKAMVDNLKYLHGVHVNLRDLTPEILARDILIPLHPGAKNYFTSIGALK